MSERPGTGGGRDAELVARLLARDERAFRELVDRYHAPMVRLATTFVPSRALAEEVAQEAWLAVLAGLSGFQGRSSLKTWIFRILSNRAKTRGVREGRSVPFSALGSGEDGDAVDAGRFASNGHWAQPVRRWNDDTPEQILRRGETVAQLQQAIDALPARPRAVLLMRDVEGFTSEDVCNILEVSETNQRVLLHRARVRVREHMDSYLAQVDTEANAAPAAGAGGRRD